MIEFMNRSKQILESFNPDGIFTEDNLDMSSLSEKAVDSNETYKIYFQHLLGFVRSCELAVGPIANSSYDVKQNVKCRKDLYIALSHAILNNLVNMENNELDMGEIYAQADTIYSDSFVTRENYRHALQLALFGQVDEKKSEYIVNSDKSTNPFMSWHERVISGYSSCLKTFVDTFGEEAVRKVVTPSLYQSLQNTPAYS